MPCPHRLVSSKDNDDDDDDDTNDDYVADATDDENDIKITMAMLAMMMKCSVCLTKLALK